MARRADWMIAIVMIAGCGGAPSAAVEAPRATEDTREDVAVSWLSEASPLPMNGRAHLAWELVIENGGDEELVVREIELDAGAFGGTSRHAGDALRARMRWLPDVDGETLPDLRDQAPRVRTDTPERIPAGRAAVFFGWAEAAADTASPVSIPHRIRLADGELEVAVPVASRAPRVLGPPLRGRGWISFGSPSDEAPHRRAVIRLGGRFHLAQRYAIDWGGIDAEGRLLREGGDPHVHADYTAYGADVIAVADGTVVRVHDGVPEQSGEATERAVPITLSTVAGNHVIVDLGDGSFAVFAHLVPGSIAVREGERVTRGQRLGRLGSSGNATGPHLHFHLCDQPELLACDGLPYVIDRFRAVPFTASGDSVASARFARDESGAVEIERELVRDERIVDFD